MTNEFENQPSQPPNLKQVAQTFRLMGWMSLWAQLVLAVISGVIYIFAGVAAAMGRSAAGNNATNPATGGGVLFAIVSLMILFYGIYQSFQFVQTGRRLRDSNPSLRPKKTDTVNFLWRSLTIRGTGLLFAVIAAEAIAGVLLGKSFMAVGAGFSIGAPLQIVQPLDIFLVSSNFNFILLFNELSYI